LAKLHEILAVEGGLGATSTKIVDEARDTFAKKADHFIESHRLLAMFAENDQNQNAEDHKAMVTTVPEKLDYVAGIVTKFLDVVYQKEATNQRATADLVVDGVTIARAVPVTMLLGLESKLTGLRDMYSAIPTLAPGRDWALDAERGKNIYRDTHPEISLKTAKTVRHKILVEPTNHHPAQIEKWHEDVPVGKVTKTIWSGMLSAAEKSDMLERLDTLIYAVKAARMRANDIQVETKRIGASLFRYINTGTLPPTSDDVVGA
jgi:hypothetical protein